MFNRRTFFARCLGAIAALPIVGRFVPQPAPDPFAGTWVFPGNDWPNGETYYVDFYAPPIEVTNLFQPTSECWRDKCIRAMRLAIEQTKRR